MFLLSSGNNFKSLRQMAVLLLFSIGYDALKWAKSLKTGLRQILVGLNVYFTMG